MSARLCVAQPIMEYDMHTVVAVLQMSMLCAPVGAKNGHHRRTVYREQLSEQRS